jgi:hypothetical protein
VVGAPGTVDAFVHRLKVSVSLAKPSVLVRRASVAEIDIVVIGVLFVMNARNAFYGILILALRVCLLMNVKTTYVVTRFGVPHASTASLSVCRALQTIYRYDNIFNVVFQGGVSSTKLGSGHGATPTYGLVVFGRHQSLASHVDRLVGFEERSDGIGEHVGIDVMFGRDISYHLVEELVDGLVYFFHGV